ncbi:stalk domain-containing protein [Paenibacillus rigui]|nr:stalk domain-containing protein [Paenibacillus rigui]
MLRNFRKTLTTVALCGSALAAGLQAPLPVEAVSTAATQIQLFPGRADALVNGVPATLEEPAVVLQDSLFVPSRWLADQMGLQLSWNEATRKISLVTPKAYLEFDADHQTVSVNGEIIAFDEAASLRNDRLMVKLSWIAPFLNMTYTYDEASRSIAIRYIGQVSTAYKESALTADDAQPNSKPIAKFAFDKPVYRLGEPVHIVDLSYDPDAEGLPGYEWTGKEEAYFKPGTYTVTLKVKDGRGNESEPFSKTIQVTDSSYLTELEYPYYTNSVGSIFSYDAGVVSASVYGSEKKQTVPVLVRQPEDRTLLRGMRTSPVAAPGFLYEDTVSGSARLYTSYVNGMNSSSQLSIVIRNQDQSKPVQVTTTRKSISAPSVYNPVRAYKTLEDYMTAPASDEELTIQPGEAVIYAASPVLSPGQGVQSIYDIQTDGKIDVAYIMTPPGLQAYDLGKYKAIPQAVGDETGTFPVSEVSWEIDARELNNQLSLTIGDDQVEPKLTGTDKRNGQAAQHPGYAGVHYRIELKTKGKLAAALHPKGGFFQGTLRVNGQTLELPEAGLTPKEIVLLGRTENSQDTALVIELMATDRTKLPLELLVLPLADK